MPLIMGILAQAAAAPTPPAAAGSYDLLETEILTGTTASVTFSSLNSTYGADYQHLQIRVVGKTDRTTDAGDSINVFFNSTAGARTHGLYGNGSSVISTNATFFTDGGRLRSSQSGQPSQAFGASIIDFLDPFETTKYTTIRSLSGADRVYLSSGLFLSTDAIASITLDQTTGSNFLAGSRFSLYGLKAA